MEGPKRPDVGGQAVIEGVMMRSPSCFTVVCRLPNGHIVIKEEAWRPVWAGMKVLRWPVIRGAVVLLESLVNGISALTFAANQQAAAEAEQEAREKGEDKMVSIAQAKAKSEDSHLAAFGMVGVSLVLALALFVATPHLIAWGLGNVFGFDASTYTFHLVDGILKMGILIGYMALISRLPDVRRVFEYHGAEHKAIFTYEKGLPLTVENARQQTRFHPRCGTSFLLIVIMVSVVLFGAFLTARLAESTLLDHALKILIKIPLMFPVAGIAYEFIKLAGKKCDTSVVARMFSAPGMWLQKITTREPNDQQLEIALISIRKTLWREALGKDAPPVGSQGIETYADAAQIALPLDPLPAAA